MSDRPQRVRPGPAGDELEVGFDQRSPSAKRASPQGDDDRSRHGKWFIPAGSTPRTRHTRMHDGSRVYLGVMGHHRLPKPFTARGQLRNGVDGADRRVFERCLVFVEASEAQERLEHDVVAADVP